MVIEIGILIFQGSITFDLDLSNETISASEK